MAIMVVKIDDRASLMMNEFFDYNGWCYALSCPRGCRKPECAQLEDFYECTVRTDWVEDVAVVFIAADEDTDAQKDVIIGWYKAAKIYRKRQSPALFLEGNIIAKSNDAILLKKPVMIDTYEFHMDNGKAYEIIEYDDERHDFLVDYVDGFSGKGQAIRYASVDSPFDKAKIRKVGAGKGNARQLNFVKMTEYCISRCEFWARRIMEDECESIAEIKALVEYAEQVVLYDKKNVEGYYYQAMGCWHLGFVKAGLRAINKALALEPIADDLIALKANLCISSGDYKKALDLYFWAFDIEYDEDYLVMAGKAYYRMGNVDEAYKTFKRVIHKEILARFEIDLEDMEHRWPFVGIRRLKKTLYGKD